MIESGEERDRTPALFNGVARTEQYGAARIKQKKIPVFKQ
jgi:hypothetical protein